MCILFVSQVLLISYFNNKKQYLQNLVTDLHLAVKVYRSNVITVAD